MNNTIGKICSIMRKAITNNGIDLNRTENKIMYKNGTNGTAFDWDVNEKTSKFVIYFDKEKTGMSYAAAIAWVNRSGNLLCFVYKEDNVHKAVDTPVVNLCTAEEAKTLADYLNMSYDVFGLYDVYVDEKEQEEEKTIPVEEYTGLVNSAKSLIDSELTFKNLQSIAELDTEETFGIFLAETGWMDWMNDFTDSDEDEEIPEEDREEIENIERMAFDEAARSFMNANTNRGI